MAPKLLPTVLFLCSWSVAVQCTFKFSVNSSFSFHVKFGKDDGGDSAPSWRIFPFQNTSLPWDERVDDLVSRLSLHEIMVQMARGGAGQFADPAPGIPRLGFGPYIFNSNCHRGDQSAPGNATAFPQSIGLGASFSPHVWKKVGTVASIETRGKHNDFVRDGVFAAHTGASCYSPVINVVRDSRWGRIQESSGEDPYMNGELAGNFLKGLHGDDDRFIRVTGGCVLFDVYSGPENIPSPRASFNANVSEEDFRMTYLPAFKKCFSYGAFSSMCSYYSINGVPACANKMLLTDILRRDWKFKGYVVSDQGAIEYIITKHKYLNTSVDTAAACINAGVNQELSNNEVNPVFMSIKKAVRAGKLDEKLVRERVKPLFYTRMRLGQFDPAYKNPFTRLRSSVVNSPEHKAAAVEVAMKTFVLLKNKAVLPLDPEKYKKVALIGPMANAYNQMFGNLPPNQDRSFAKTPYEGLSEVFKDIQYEAVCKEETKCPSYDSDKVKKLTEDKDLIIAAFGTGPAVEKEKLDRSDLYLPGKQKELLEDIIKHKDAAKIVLLLFNAGPLNITFADTSEGIDAIMECFFPGQATGEAIANVLTNKGGNSSPAGRLPITWPKHETQLPPMEDYSMKGRTYRYLQTAPLYPFGYGLSYTEFQYVALATVQEVKPKEDLDVDITIKNKGKLDADEVVQCYISWPDKSLPVPIRQLGYFNRVHIKAGETIKLSASISWEKWAYWKNGRWNIKAGRMDLDCGGQQPEQEKRAPSNILKAHFQISNSIFFRDAIEHPVQP